MSGRKMWAQKCDVFIFGKKEKTILIELSICSWLRAAAWFDNTISTVQDHEIGDLIELHALAPLHSNISSIAINNN